MIELNKIIHFNTLKVSQANHTFDFTDGICKFTGEFLFVKEDKDNQVIYHINSAFNAFEINLVEEQLT